MSEIKQIVNCAIHAESTSGREFNTRNEVTMHFRNNINPDEVPPSGEVVLLKTVKEKFIDSMSNLSEPLAFPLFFPHGEPGWGLDHSEAQQHLQDELLNEQAEQNTKHSPHISLLQYTRWKLLHEERFSLLENLRQEYVLTQYIRNENNKLDWFKFNQKKLNMATKQQVQDQTLTQNVENNAPGHVFVPSTFTGSYTSVSRLIQLHIIIRLRKTSNEAMYQYNNISHECWPIV